MSTGRKRRKRSARQNTNSFLNWYYRLKNLALSVYEWKNLPPSMDERFLELTLFEKGYAVIFEDDVMGLLGLTCTIGGKLNVYNIPTDRVAFSTSGYQKHLTDRDSVLVYNNYSHLPTDWITRQYAMRISQVERAMDVNVNAQKTPLMILCDEQQKLTMENFYLQYDGNVPFIFANKDFPMDSVTVLKTDAPYVAGSLQVLKNFYINEYLTFIGIENANMDKKERLVADEVKGNDGQIEAERFVMLNSRRDAAKKVNRMFGTDISVDFRSDLATPVNIVNLDPEIVEKGGMLDV